MRGWIQRIFQQNTVNGQCRTLCKLFDSFWVPDPLKKFSGPSSGKADEDPAAENRRLKRELARVTEERDILKKATAYFARGAK